MDAFDETVRYAPILDVMLHRGVSAPMWFLVVISRERCSFWELGGLMSRSVLLVLLEADGY